MGGKPVSRDLLPPSTVVLSDGTWTPPTEAPMSETEPNNRDLCQVSGEYAPGGLTLFRLKATLGSSAVELVLTRGFVLGADQNVRLG